MVLKTIRRLKGDKFFLFCSSALIFLYITCRYVGNILNLIIKTSGLEISQTTFGGITHIYDVRFHFLILLFAFLILYFIYTFNKYFIYTFNKLHLKHHLNKILNVLLIREKIDKLDFLVKEEKYALLFLLAVTIMVRLLYFFTIDYYGGDTVARMIHSQEMAKGAKILSHLPFLFPNPHWPPLHFWFISLLYLFIGDIFITPKLVSLFFGVASVLPFYFIAKEVAGKKAAFFSALFFSFYEPHIFLSTVAFAEVPALFFVLMALFFFFRYLRLNNKKEIILSAIFLNLASMLRIEFCIILVPLFLALLIKRERCAFLFCALASIFPIFWLVFEYLFTGNPFNFFTLPVGMMPYNAESIFNRNFAYSPLAKLFYSALSILPLTKGLILLLGLVGLAYSFTKQKIRVYSFIFIFIFSVYYTLAVTIPMYFSERHVLMAHMLFLLFIYLGCEGLTYAIKKYYKNPYFKKDLFVIILVCIALIFFVQVSNEKFHAKSENIGESVLPNVLQTVNWLKDNTTDGAVFIMKKESQPLFPATNRAHVLFTLALYDAYRKKGLQLVMIDPQSNLSTVEGLMSSGEAYTSNNDKVKLTPENTYFIVIINRSESSSELSHDCQTEKISDYTLECIFENTKNKMHLVRTSQVYDEEFFRIYKVEKIRK